VDTFKLGTRGSQLALYQANTVATLLRERAGSVCDVVVIKTSGDRLAEATLSQIGGKRLFVKEIEDALLEGTIDLAVHSSKDMPVVLPEGLEVGAVLAREDPRDAVVLPGPPKHACPSLEAVVAHLGRAPRVGTSSIRRTAQLTRIFPGARFLPIRGNLDTRLRKLDSGDFDALVLASAGLRRLEHADRVSASLPITACVPAPGQGIIAVEIRGNDHRVRHVVTTIEDRGAAAALLAERAVVRRLGGGCQMPIGAFASITGNEMTVVGVVISLDGARAVRAELKGDPAEAETLGTQVGDRLLEQGAATILQDVQRAQVAVEGIQP
jgi:hydroxymethylbilane synthase